MENPPYRRNFINLSDISILKCLQIHAKSDSVNRTLRALFNAKGKGIIEQFWDEIGFPTYLRSSVKSIRSAQETIRWLAEKGLIIGYELKWQSPQYNQISPKAARILKEIGDDWRKWPARLDLDENGEPDFSTAQYVKDNS